MIITIDRRELLAGINTVNSALSARTTMPILENIKIEAKVGKGLLLTATDLDIGMHCTVEGMIMEAGEICVPGKLFRNMINSLGGDTVELSLDDNNVSVKSNGTKVKVQGFPTDNYPKLPEAKPENLITISGKKLADMIKSVISCVSNDNSRPVLAGGNLIVEKQGIKLVTLDGYRMGIAGFTNQENINTEFEAIVPKKTLDILRGLGNEDVELGVAAVNSSSKEVSHILARSGSTTVISRLIGGSYVDYKSIMVRGKHELNVNPITFLNGVNRASILTDKKQGRQLVSLEIESDQMTIKGRSELGNIMDHVAVNGFSWEEEKPFEIAFNGVFLSDILKHINSEVTITIETPLRPITIEPATLEEGEMNLNYLVLPVRVA